MLYDDDPDGEAENPTAICSPLPVVPLLAPATPIPPIVYRIRAMDTILGVKGSSKITTLVLEKPYKFRQVSSLPT